MYIVLDIVHSTMYNVYVHKYRVLCTMYYMYVYYVICTMYIVLCTIYYVLILLFLSNCYLKLKSNRKGTETVPENLNKPFFVMNPSLKYRAKRLQSLL